MSVETITHCLEDAHLSHAAAHHLEEAVHEPGAVHGGVWRRFWMRVMTIMGALGIFLTTTLALCKVAGQLGAAPHDATGDESATIEALLEQGNHIQMWQDERIYTSLDSMDGILTPRRVHRVVITPEGYRGNETLELLESCADLVGVTASGTNLTDEDLSRIGRMKVEDVHVEDCANLTDAGIERFAANGRELVWCFIDDLPRLSDRSADALIASNLDNLEYLSVGASNFSPSAIQRIQERYPSVVIRHAATK